jgi:hypothetical protein
VIESGCVGGVEVGVSEEWKFCWRIVSGCVGGLEEGVLEGCQMV